LLAALATVVTIAPVRAEPDANVGAPYDIVVELVVRALPTPLQAHYAGEFDELKRLAACAGLRTDRRDGRTPVQTMAACARAACHFVRSDAEAADESTGNRHAAALRFPRSEEAALELFRKRKVEGGRLPWELGEHFETLAAAMKAGNRGDVLKETAWLIHLATDAALPWNVSTRESDPISKQSDKNRFASAAPDGSWQTRFLLTFLPPLAERLRIEAQIAPSRAAPVQDPTGEVFEALQRTHDAWVMLDALDSIHRAPGVDPSSKANDCLDFSEQELIDRSAPHIESWLENAALLAARLIVTAWWRADQPTASQIQPTISAAKAPPGDQLSEPAGVDDLTWVASQHGKVFHRSTCAHVRRIRAENRLTFVSREEAQRTGRTPCRSCQPDTP
jgi:hypothetical protein